MGAQASSTTIGILLAVTTACGGDAPAPEPAADTSALRRLAPADAVAVVGVPSIDALDQALARLCALFEHEPPSVLAWLADLAPDWPARLIDRRRPLLVAFRPGTGWAAPIPVFLLPVTDAQAARDHAPEGATHVDGDYVGFSPDPSYVPGGVLGPATLPLPDGPFALRADLDALLSPLRPMAEAMVPALAATMPAGTTLPGGMDVGALFATYVRVAFEVIASVESVELALDFDGDQLVAQGQLDLAPDSILATLPAASTPRLDERLAWLDGGAACQMVLAADTRAGAGLLRRALLALQSAWPGSASDAWEEYAATAEVLAVRCGHVLVGDFDFAKEGARLRYLLEAEDPDALVPLLARWVDQGQQLVGGQPADIAESTRDGRPSFELAVDMGAVVESVAAGSPAADAETAAMMERLYGEDAVLHYVVTAADDHVVLTGGTRPLDDEQPPQQHGPRHVELDEALARLGPAGTRLVLRLDYAALIAGMLELGDSLPVHGATPPVPDGPIAWTLWAGGSGARWTAGTSLDMTELARMYEQR